jgi:molybdenum cofactor biosynthesis enzyme MoaA
MPDTFGRVGTDQRVSVTGRCNLVCTYRMPVGASSWVAKPEILTDQGALRLRDPATTEASGRPARSSKRREAEVDHVTQATARP